MKPTILSTLFAAALALVFSFTSGFADDTPIGKEMDQLADAYKALRKALKAPDPAQAATYREWSGAIVKHAEAASGMTPAYAEKQMPEAREKMLAEFREAMAVFLEKAKAMDRAVADGKYAEAAELAEGMNDLKKKGHEKFQEPEE